MAKVLKIPAAMQHNHVKRVRILELGFATNNCEEFNKTSLVFTVLPFKMRRLDHVSFKGPCSGSYGYSEPSYTAEASKLETTFLQTLLQL